MYYIMEGNQRRDYRNLKELLEDFITEDTYEVKLNCLEPISIMGYEFPCGTAFKKLDYVSFMTCYNTYINNLVNIYVNQITDFGNKTTTCLGLTYSYKIEEIGNRTIYYVDTEMQQEEPTMSEREMIINWINFFEDGEKKGAKISSKDCKVMFDYLSDLLDYKDEEINEKYFEDIRDD